MDTNPQKKDDDLPPLPENMTGTPPEGLPPLPENLSGTTEPPRGDAAQKSSHGSVLLISLLALVSLYGAVNAWKAWQTGQADAAHLAANRAALRQAAHSTEALAEKYRSLESLAAAKREVLSSLRSLDAQLSELRKEIRHLESDPELRDLKINIESLKRQKESLQSPPH